MAVEKKISIVVYFILLVGFVCASLRSSKCVSSPKGGESICFIMGEDKNSETFYTLGAEHFQEDRIVKTDRMISHIRSLESLVRFLNFEKPDTPYERIEIVLHGNTWSGMATDIVDGGERAYPKDFLKAVLLGELPKLQPGVIDTHTVINIWSCGIGRNPIINLAFTRLFTDTNDVLPKVHTSKDFVIFRRVKENEPAQRLSANFWPYFFKRGLRPSESYIASELAKQYPEEDKPWLGILQDEELDKNEFERSFHVPVSWTVIYDEKEDRPGVNTEEEKMNWIHSQPSLMKKIDELEIPIDKYNWTVNKIIHTDANGDKVPAIKAIGMSTVLCVLEEDKDLLKS